VAEGCTIPVSELNDKTVVVGLEDDEVEPGRPSLSARFLTGVQEYTEVIIMSKGQHGPKSHDSLLRT